MPTIPHQTPAASEPLQPVAAVLAFLFPGLGHYYLGYTRRAVLISAGVLGLFAGGLLIGGIDSVDREENFIWFLGQSLVGPTTLVVNYVHQHHFKVIDPHTCRTGPDGRLDPATGRVRNANPEEFRNPDTGMAVPISIDSSGKTSATWFDRSGQKIVTSPAGPPMNHSLGRMNELGTLYTTIAGFMNLICILDALWHTPRPKTRPIDPSLPRTLKLANPGAAGGAA